jgi:hypothetical protein
MLEINGAGSARGAQPPLFIWRVQVHDANVVTTMLVHGERRLLTFNEADFRRFTALIEVVTP